MNTVYATVSFGFRVVVVFYEQTCIIPANKEFSCSLILFRIVIKFIDFCTCAFTHLWTLWLNVVLNRHALWLLFPLFIYWRSKADVVKEIWCRSTSLVWLWITSMPLSMNIEWLSSWDNIPFGQIHTYTMFDPESRTFMARSRTSLHDPSEDRYW